MSKFWGITRYEYLMGVRRWGLWLAMVLAALPTMFPIASADEGVLALNANLSPWTIGGDLGLMSNYLLPVVGGIAIADRLPRDYRLRVIELLSSAPISTWAYILGKYMGSVLAVITPVFGINLLCAGFLIAHGSPVAILPATLAAFVTINLPAYLFVGAFSIACTAVLPVRVYQVLLPGYWIWGNFVTPDYIPSISDTILTPVGGYMAGGFFNAYYSREALSYTALDGLASLVALITCAVVALVALERFMTWQESRA